MQSSYIHAYLPLGCMKHIWHLTASKPQRKLHTDELSTLIDIERNEAMDMGDTRKLKVQG